MMATALSPLKSIRRGKILDIAERHFAAFGYRGSSVEAIAEAAGVSKVTLYGYFPSKDRLFAAVAEAVAERIEGAVTTALQQPGRAGQRIAAALIAKHRLVHDVVRRSPLAGELFATTNLLAQELFQALDRQIEDAVGATLADAGWPSDEVNVLAPMLFAAAQGISAAARSCVDGEQQIDRLVCALVPGRSFST